MANVTKKDKALELMKKIGIFKPYIDGFKQEGLVCYFEGFGGFWDYQNPIIENKRKEIEKRYKCVVYAITHEFVEGEEMYSFLLVTNCPEDWDYSAVCSPTYVCDLALRAPL